VNCKIVGYLYFTIMSVSVGVLVLILVIEGLVLVLVGSVLVNITDEI